MNFESLDYLKKLTKLMNDNSLSEISLADGNKSVTLKKEFAVQQPTLQKVVLPENVANEVQTEEKQPPVSKKNPITSPMVGSFYAAPSPNDRPFVKVGDTVAPGQVVCIVEAMKLMNEIEAEVSGKIVEICVEDGQSVEYGQVLMYVE